MRDLHCEGDCKMTHVQFQNSKKYILEFENDERAIGTSFEITIAEYHSQSYRSPRCNCRVLCLP